MPTPNFFERGERLLQSDYDQFLVSKHFAKRLIASTDYTFDRGAHTLREAALIRLPETKVLDSLRTEFYQRPNTVQGIVIPFASGSGFAFTATKKLFKRFALDGGFESVDYSYGVTASNVVLQNFGFTVNGDSYSTGQHVFAHASYKATPYLTFSGFAIHLTKRPPADQFSFAGEGYNYAMTLDLKNLLVQHGH